jgi:hypothetical protein
LFTKEELAALVDASQQASRRSETRPASDIQTRTSLAAAETVESTFAKSTFVCNAGSASGSKKNCQAVMGGTGLLGSGASELIPSAPAAAIAVSAHFVFGYGAVTTE